MANKDINIHVRAKGTEEARQAIEGVGKSTQHLGDTTESAGKRGAEGLEKSSEAMNKQQGILSGLVGKVSGLFGAWKVVETIIGLLDQWADRLRTIQQLQRDIHTQSLSLLEAGQAFEIQTGTVGKQGEWAKFLVEVQKAGRMGSIGDTLEVATAFDIAMGSRGGTAENKELLKQIVPMFGASGVSGGAAAQFIKYAGTAGIAPTETAYKDFYAKVMMGFRSSDSRDFGQFLTGLQSGTTGMILQGASPENAISMYATAMSVTKNEAAAATLAEQMTRLSSGAYAKPREALEGFAGTSWGSLTPDNQFDVLLRYAASLPENQRVQLLTDQGFSPELAGGISKIASPDTLQTLDRTRQKVGSASGRSVQQQIDAFQQTPVGKSRELAGKTAEDSLRTEDEVGGWMFRLQAAEQHIKNLSLKGQDSFWDEDDVEAGIYAYQQMIDELEEIASSAESQGTSRGKKTASRARALQNKLRRSQGVMRHQADDEIPILSRIQEVRRRRNFSKGPAYESELDDIRGGDGGVVINNYISNDVIYQEPGRASGERFGPAAVETD